MFFSGQGIWRKMVQIALLKKNNYIQMCFVDDGCIGYSFETSIGKNVYWMTEKKPNRKTTKYLHI
jgi:hypothetical protein